MGTLEQASEQARQRSFNRVWVVYVVKVTKGFGVKEQDVRKREIVQEWFKGQQIA